MSILSDLFRRRRAAAPAGGGREAIRPQSAPVDSRDRDRDLANLIAERGLRPLGNKRRLLYVEGKQCRMYAALFRDRGQAERYSQLMAEHASQTPPPSLVETMVAFAPKTIYSEKFAFICPYPGDDDPAYRDWARSAMRSCNDTLCQENYFSGYGYDQVIPNLDSILDWNMLLPRAFALGSRAADELLCDPADGGFQAVRMASSSGASAPVAPHPQGPWVGMLLALSSFREWAQEDAVAGQNKTAALLNVLGSGKLRNCVVHGTTYAEDSSYWCLAIHAADAEQAAMIEASARQRGTPACRALAGARVLSPSQVPKGLPYNGYLGPDGIYLGN